jgi:hypothetical protein
LSAVSENERQQLKQIKTIDDLLAVQAEFATIISLKLENKALADAFIASNMLYIASILNIDLNPAQQADILDEIGQVGWLTMADFKLFLDRMKRHKFYHRDYQELIVEFWKYADERLERAGQMTAGNKPDEIDAPRTGQINHIRDLEIMRINAKRYEEPRR